MGTGTYPDVQAYLPTDNPTPEVLAERKRCIIAGIPNYPTSGQGINNAISHTCIDTFFGACGNLSAATSHYQAFKALRSDIITINQNGRQIDPVTAGSVHAKYVAAATAVDTMAAAFARLMEGMNQSGWRERFNIKVNEEATLIQHPFVNLEPVELVAFLASFQEEYFTPLGNGQFQISIPTFMMSNTENVRACFELNLKFSVSRNADQTFQIRAGDITVDEVGKMWGFYNESAGFDGRITRSRRSESRAPHVNSGGRICLGANESEICDDLDAKRYSGAFARVLNSLDLYNGSSPYMPIMHGIGSFDTLTGEWAWEVYDVNCNNQRVTEKLCRRNMTQEGRAKPEVLANAKYSIERPALSLINLQNETTSLGLTDTIGLVAVNGSVMESNSSSAFKVSKSLLFHKIKERVSWHQAIKRIGRPAEGELFIECGSELVLNANSSWLGYRPYGFRVYRSGEYRPSDGYKIILEEDWFDLAFRELSLMIEKKLRDRPMEHSIVFNREPIIPLPPFGGGNGGGLAALEAQPATPAPAAPAPRPRGRSRSVNSEAEARARELLGQIRTGLTQAVPAQTATVVASGEDMALLRAEATARTSTAQQQTQATNSQTSPAGSPTTQENTDGIIEVGIIDTNEGRTFVRVDTTQPPF